MNSRSESYAKTMLSKTGQVHSWRIVRFSMLEEHVTGIYYVESNLAPPLYFKKAVTIQKIPFTKLHMYIFQTTWSSSVVTFNLFVQELARKRAIT